MQDRLKEILLIIDCIPLAIVRTFRGLNIAAVSEFFVIFEIDWSVIDDFFVQSFFFTARLLKNCYQDTWLKSEEFCTNGLCLTFAMSINRLHKRVTNVNIAQKRENLHLIVFESENVFILTYTVE